MDRHLLAAISITGISLDFLGGMYLAYDLLGGKHGPLRTVTRAVTYGALFGAGYGLPLGLVLGLAAGVTHGITLALEFSRASRQEPNYSFACEIFFSVIRGIGLAIGVFFLFGLRFAIAFGILSTVGQAFAYSRGLRPALDYQPRSKPGISKRQALAAVNRAVGYTIAGVLSGLIAHQGGHVLAFGVKVGLVIGLVSAFVNFVSPYVEWWADNLPERRLGAFGVMLILAGFALQSTQYWVALLDVPVK